MLPLPLPLPLSLFTVCLSAVSWTELLEEQLQRQHASSQSASMTCVSEDQCVKLFSRENVCRDCCCCPVILHPTEERKREREGELALVSEGRHTTSSVFNGTQEERGRERV